MEILAALFKISFLLGMSALGFVILCHVVKMSLDFIIVLLTGAINLTSSTRNSNGTD